MISYCKGRMSSKGLGLIYVTVGHLNVRTGKLLPVPETRNMAHTKFTSLSPKPLCIPVNTKHKNRAVAYGRVSV